MAVGGILGVLYYVSERKAKERLRTRVAKTRVTCYTESKKKKRDSKRKRSCDAMAHAMRSSFFGHLSVSPISSFHLPF